MCTLLLVLGSLAVPMIAVGSAWAQEINSCVRERNGNLRVVSDATECRRRESPLAWNQQGPAGLPGPKGEQGDPGAQGPPGATLRVVDANGVDLGLFVGGTLHPDSAGIGAQVTPIVYDETVGALVRYAMHIGSGNQGEVFRDLPRAGIAFESNDCTGDALVGFEFGGWIFKEQQSDDFAAEPLLFRGRNEPWRVVTPGSRIDFDNAGQFRCGAGTGGQRLIAADPVSPDLLPPEPLLAPLLIAPQ